jgi:hypothetical protein
MGEEITFTIVGSIFVAIGVVLALNLLPTPETETDFKIGYGFIIFGAILFSAGLFRLLRRPS